MKYFRQLSLVLLTAVITAASPATGAFHSHAAEDRTSIDSIHLNVSSTIEAGSSGGNVYITTSDNEYRVGSVEITNENDDWKGGMQPRVSFSLYAYSGYYFNSASKSLFSFSGDEATFVTAKREDDKSTLTVTIKLDKLDNGDLSVSGLYWDESTGTACWDENSGAKSYQVRLFRNDSSVTSSRSTSNTYYEFSSDITRKGDYYFEVRAVGSGSEKGDWESSDTWYVTAAEADDLSYEYNSSSQSGGPGVPAGSTTTGSSTGGYWCLDQYGWWYRNADGTYTINNWQVIDGLWYYFNESGYMRTGWIPYNDKWYYCDTDGHLMSNCRTPDGYYVGGDGVWIS
ncbi:MAG: hypothetical protein ACRDBO_16925 [Lachnospiraceae bacterium]